MSPNELGFVLLEPRLETREAATWELTLQLEPGAQREVWGAVHGSWPSLKLPLWRVLQGPGSPTRASGVSSPAGSFDLLKLATKDSFCYVG